MPFGLHSIEGRGVSRIRCLITRGKFLGAVYSIGWRMLGMEAGKSDNCCNSAWVSLSVLQIMSFGRELGDSIGEGNYSSML